MTELTPNGWPVQKPGSDMLDVLKVGGRSFRVRKDTIPIWSGFLTYMNLVEPFSEKGWDGGHSYRKNTNNNSVWSEHAGGCAVDLNAEQHPNGSKSPYEGYSRHQQGLIKWYLETRSEGHLIKWGAYFSGSHDAMHYELEDPDAVAKWLKAHGFKK